MRQSLWKSTLAILCGLATFTISSAPVSLHRAKASAVQRTISYEATVAQFETFVGELQPYVERAADGTLVLAAPRSVTARVDARWLVATQQGMARFNDLVRQGVLATTVTLWYVSGQGTAAELTVQDGRNAIYYYWWGQQLYLSHALLSKMYTGIASASTAVIVTSLAVAGLPTWPAGVLIALGIGALWGCDGLGGWNGIVVTFPSALPPYCWHQ